MCCFLHAIFDEIDLYLLFTYKNGSKKSRYIHIYLNIFINFYTSYIRTCVINEEENKNIMNIRNSIHHTHLTHSSILRTSL